MSSYNLALDHSVTRSFPSDFSLKLYSLLTSKQPNFSEALALIRKHDLAQGEETVQAEARAKGRCPVCTLPVPCKHYASDRELKKDSGRRREGTPPDLSLISVRTVDSRKEKSIDDIPCPDSDKPSNLRRFRIRYRSHRDISYSYSKRSVSLSTCSASKRLKVLEKLDKFRECKYKSEIERIEELKRQEDAARKQSIERDRRRAARNRLLKMAIAKHHEDLVQIQHEKQEASIRELEQRRLVETYRLRYLQKQVNFTQKAKLLEYKSKRQLIEGIQREQVGELGEKYAEKAVYGKKRYYEVAV